MGAQEAHLLLTVIPGRFANYFIDVDKLDDDDHATVVALLEKYEVALVK